MKKNLLIIAMVLFGLSTQAQFSFAPKIGFGATSTANKVGATSNNSVTSLYVDAGLEARYQVLDFLSIESGLGYRYCTHEFDNTVNLLIISIKSNTSKAMHYVNVPLEVVYRKKSGGFYGGAGMNFGFGLSGKETVKTNTLGLSTTAKSDIAFDGKDNSTVTDTKQHLKLLNMGVNIKAGYSFKKYFVGANACIGVSDLLADKTASFKTTSYGVHFGVVLGGAKKPAKK